MNYECSSPTYTKSLALIVKMFIEKYFRMSKKKLEYGIYNFSGDVSISRYTFAKKIIEIMKAFILIIILESQLFRINLKQKLKDL